MVTRCRNGQVVPKHKKISWRCSCVSGGELPELAPVRGWQYPCGARVCGGLHDSYGFHPGTCRAGNRYGLWTLRHDAVQLMLVYVVRRLGFQALSCSAGAGNWFGWSGGLAGRQHRL